MKRTYRIVNVAWIVVGLYVARASIDLRLFTRAGEPGPGFFPLLIAIVLTFVSIIAIMKPGSTSLADPPLLPSGAALRQLGGTILSLALTVVALPVLGAFVTVLLLQFFLIRVIGHQSLLTSIITSTLGALAIVFVFGSILGVPLPRGVFGL